MKHIKHTIIGLLLILSSNAPCQDKETIIDLRKPRQQFQIIGELGFKLGTELRVKGIVWNGMLHRKYPWGPTLIIQMINDKPVQQYIQIPISSYYVELGVDSLSKLEFNSTYNFNLYESGKFVGIPHREYKDWTLMSPSPEFHFQNNLIITTAQKIKPIEWTPDLFINENGLLSGIAKNENDTVYIVRGNWKLELKGSKKWTKSEIGKEVEVYGKVQKTEKSNNYFIENSTPRLVKLEDQVGKTVKLRGIAWSNNGYWWFNYRGIDIYVEKMEELPNWDKTKMHGERIEISGTLEIDNLPDIRQYTLKDKPDLKEYYIVRNASWKAIDGLLTPELDLTK